MGERYHHEEQRGRDKGCSMGKRVLFRPCLLLGDLKGESFCLICIVEGEAVKGGLSNAPSLIRPVPGTNAKLTDVPSPHRMMAP